MAKLDITYLRIKGCSISPVRNTNSMISEISNSSTTHPKFSRKKVIDSCIAIDSQKQKLKDVCRTRWIECIDSFTTFYDFSLYILKTLEAITMPRTHSEFGQWLWDSEITTNANGFLHQVTNVIFLVTFCTTMTVLSIIHGLTIKLQKQC